MVDLKKCREAAGLTQDDLAEKVGVSRQAISNIENGVAKPNVPNAKKIAEILKINWSEFYDEAESSG